MYKSLLKKNNDHTSTIADYLVWFEEGKDVKDAPGIPHFIRMIGRFRTRTLGEFRFWFERYVEHKNGIEPEDAAGWEAYETQICQKMRVGEIPLREGVDRLERLYCISVDGWFKFWFWLYEEIWWVEDSNKSYYFEVDGIDAFVLKCVDQALACLALGMAQDFYLKCICRTCLKVADPRYEYTKQPESSRHGGFIAHVYLSCFS